MESLAQSNNQLDRLKIDSIDVFYNDSRPVVFMSLKHNGSIVYTTVDTDQDQGRY